MAGDGGCVMWRSIRWRLVMGAMLLTLLTVSAVGVVALLLMQRYMVQQERAYLTANAQAIAKQAVSFMTPVQVAPPLQQLAQTAAFLGDVTVRIVDNSQMALADSAVAFRYSATVGIATSPIYFRIAAPPPAQVNTLLPPMAEYVVDRYWRMNIMNILWRRQRRFPQLRLGWCKRRMSSWCKSRRAFGGIG